MEDQESSKEKKTINKWVLLFILILISPIIIWIVVFLTQFATKEPENCSSPNAISAAEFAIRKKFPLLTDAAIRVFNPSEISSNNDDYICRASLETDEEIVAINYDYNAKEKVAQNIKIVVPNCEDSSVISDAQQIFIDGFTHGKELQLIINTAFLDMQTLSFDDESYQCSARIELDVKDLSFKKLIAPITYDVSLGGNGVETYVSSQWNQADFTTEGANAEYPKTQAVKESFDSKKNEQKAINSTKDFLFNNSSNKNDVDQAEGDLFN